MKMLKYFLLASVAIFFSIAGLAQNNLQVRTTVGSLSPVAKISNITTTNATATHVDSIVIADNTAGIFTIEGVGAAATGKAVTGVLIYRYSKSSGTLTIGSANTVSPIVADTEVSGGTFSLAATASNNAQLKATGKVSTTMRWRFKVIQTFPVWP